MCTLDLQTLVSITKGCGIQRSKDRWASTKFHTLLLAKISISEHVTL
jgi:hypothetical protein